MTASITTDVQLAARVLRDGGLVAFGTETVYGLGANALDVNAVARVFEAKQRPHFDPLIVHIADRDQLASVASSLTSLEEELIEQFWPGPLTLVLPKQQQVPDLVTSGLPSVAVRMPNHELARELIREAGVPVAAPSANPFGRISPTCAEHVLEHLGEKIDLILNGGPCEVGVESTVACVHEGSVEILRPGGVTLEEIQTITPNVSFRQSTSKPGVSATSPGQLEQHYAPRTPLVIVEHFDSQNVTPRTGILSLGPVDPRLTPAVLEVLSPDESLVEATANFFAALRRLDASGVEQIVATPFPQEGLGIALNDRLRRAASK